MTPSEVVTAEQLKTALDLIYEEKEKWHAEHPDLDPCVLCLTAATLLEDAELLSKLMVCVLSPPLIAFLCASYFLAGIQHERNNRWESELERMMRRDSDDGDPANS